VLRANDIVDDSDMKQRYNLTKVLLGGSRGTLSISRLRLERYVVYGTGAELAHASCIFRDNDIEEELPAMISIIETSSLMYGMQEALPRAFNMHEIRKKLASSFLLKDAFP
jgi:hypothetical protein